MHFFPFGVGRHHQTGSGAGKKSGASTRLKILVLNAALMERLTKARILRAFVLNGALVINPTQELLAHGDVARSSLSWLLLEAKLGVSSQNYSRNISAS